MMAARSTPGSVFSTKCAIAFSAPVLPALTQAAARPLLTSSTATRMEESFLRRIASRGLSLMVTTWLARTTSVRARSSSGSESTRGPIVSGSPTRSTRSAASSRREPSAPAMYSGGG